MLKMTHGWICSENALFWRGVITKGRAAKEGSSLKAS